MKFDCGPTWEEKVEAKSKWHRCFAWFPVRIASHDCRWLEVVERKGKRSGMMDPAWAYEYRGVK